MAFSFDDGPNEPYTSRLLSVLKENNIKATFFLMGINTEKYPDAAKKILKGGHEIGNHTFNHPFLTQVTTDTMHMEVLKTEQTLKRLTGKKTSLLRAPHGAINPAIVLEAKRLGYPLIQWDISSRDWQKISAAKMNWYILRQVRNGSIFLFHDGAPPETLDRTEMLRALQMLIDELKKRGYAFVTVSELFR